MSRSTYELGDRFEPRRPFRLGRDAPSKMARRSIREHEVRTVLARNVIIGMVEERDRYVLLGEVDAAR